LHYNWHRHYDASIGRYTQPDPLGFVDGPSVYGYVKSTPAQAVDVKGLFKMCHRPLAIGGFTGYRHCYLSFSDGSSSSFDQTGVHPEKDPTHPDTQCTADRDRHLDNCLRMKMQRCNNYSIASNNCCHCVKYALRSCGARVSPEDFPDNFPFN
jgi:hypothetical protein